MNKVTTINLNGRAYQLEERGFEILHSYLDTAGAKLAGNPDKDEIMADFEQAIADKFDQKLSPNKNVVLEREVEEIIAAMGPVEGADGVNEHADGTKNAMGSDEKKSGDSNGAAKAGPRRLYRLPGTEWIMGVCAGLAAYFNIDVTLMRVIWILLTIFTHGFWILAYIILAVVMPPAKTEEQYAQAYGWSTRPPFNAHDFIEEAKKRYAELQKMHEEHKAKYATGTAAGTSAADAATASASTMKEDVHKWKREFKEEMRAKKQKMKQEWRAQQRQWHEARRQAPDWRYHNDVSPNDAYNERRYGAGYGISRAIFGFFAVLVSLVLLALGVAFVVSLVSLIKFGTVFGYTLGAGQPLWIPIVFLAAAFYIIASPFRMLIQHAWGNSRYQSGWADFGRGVVFLAVLVLLAYTARDLFPQANAWYGRAVGWLAARR